MYLLNIGLPHSIEDRCFLFPSLGEVVIYIVAKQVIFSTAAARFCTSHRKFYLGPRNSAVFGLYSREAKNVAIVVLEPQP
jgi:hypothetical protein